METKPKSELLEAKLVKEKQSWNITVKDLVSQIRHIDNISDAQVLMLSYRHQLGDKSNEMRNIISRQKSNMWVSRKIAYKDYKENATRKYSQGEINDFIDADLRDIILTIAILENQLEYYRMTMDTLDKMGFAISNKVTLATRF
jgi:hypothetical protein